MTVVDFKIDPDIDKVDLHPVKITINHRFYVTCYIADRR